MASKVLTALLLLPFLIGYAQGKMLLIFDPATSVIIATTTVDDDHVNEANQMDAPPQFDVLSDEFGPKWKKNPSGTSIVSMVDNDPVPGGGRTRGERRSRKAASAARKPNFTAELDRLIAAPGSSQELKDLAAAIKTYNGL